MNKLHSDCGLFFFFDHTLHSSFTLPLFCASVLLEPSASQQPWPSSPPWLRALLSLDALISHKLVLDVFTLSKKYSFLHGPCTQRVLYIIFLLQFLNRAKSDHHTTVNQRTTTCTTRWWQHQSAQSDNMTPVQSQRNVTSYHRNGMSTLHAEQHWNKMYQKPRNPSLQLPQPSNPVACCSCLVP